MITQHAFAGQVIDHRSQLMTPDNELTECCVRRNAKKKFTEPVEGKEGFPCPPVEKHHDMHYKTGLASKAPPHFYREIVRQHAARASRAHHRERAAH
ncbi:MAG TPA: hypothetical protein VJ654_02610 [Noviherbaspirillum sp.]|nr:hypothetical protein [Noviherbaspirillum sp.]